MPDLWYLPYVWPMTDRATRFVQVFFGDNAEADSPIGRVLWEEDVTVRRALWFQMRRELKAELAALLDHTE